MNGLFPKSELRLLQQKDAKAMDRWVRDHADALYTFIFYRACKDADLAADVVQETFAEALKKLKKYDPNRGSMLAWLTTLSKNKIKKALRARRKHVSYEQAWLEIDTCLLRAYERIATEPLPHEILETKETAELVQMTLANIPGNYKHVLAQYYHHQKTIKEIAASLEISDGAVKALLHRARKAFKEAFLKLTDSMGGREISIEVPHE